MSLLHMTQCNDYGMTLKNFVLLLIIVWNVSFTYKHLLSSRNFSQLIDWAKCCAKWRNRKVIKEMLMDLITKRIFISLIFDFETA